MVDSLSAARRESPGAFDQLVAQNERGSRRKKVAVRVLWIFCVVCSIAFLWFDGRSANVSKAPRLALFMFLVGAVELLNHFINRWRIDLLKEVKPVQVQILEAHAALPKDASAQPPASR